MESPLPSCCAPGAPLMPEAERQRLASRLKALADPTRIGIVNQLARDGEVCVCQLVERFDLAQPTISHHLRLLREAGLVRAAKRGTWAYYELIPEAVGEVAGALMQTPTGRSPDAPPVASDPDDPLERLRAVAARRPDRPELTPA